MKQPTVTDMESLDTERLVFTGINSFLAIITTIANIFVLILFFQQRKTLRKTHAFVVSLGIGDLLQGCVGIPLTIVLCFTAPLESAECVTICAVRLSICFTSLFNTVAASLERFWAVNYPIHYRTKATGGIIGGEMTRFIPSSLVLFHFPLVSIHFSPILFHFPFVLFQFHSKCFIFHSFHFIFTC